MATYTNPLAFMKAFEKRLNDQRMTARDAHKLMAAENYFDALELVSGKLTPAQTKGAFARRRAQGSTRRRLPGKAPMLPINVQSGLLKRSMQMKEMDRTPQTFELHNSAPYAKYLLFRGGTVKMVDRGFLTETNKRFRARNKAFGDYYNRNRRIT